MIRQHIVIACLTGAMHSEVVRALQLMCNEFRAQWLVGRGEQQRLRRSGSRAVARVQQLVRIRSCATARDAVAQAQRHGRSSEGCGLCATARPRRPTPWRRYSSDGNGNSGQCAVARQRVVAVADDSDGGSSCRVISGGSNNGRGTRRCDGNGDMCGCGMRRSLPQSV